MTTPFNEALVKERMRFQLRRSEIGNACGVGAATVDCWEKGTAVPDKQQFKRLVGLFRRMHHHPPHWVELPGPPYEVSRKLHEAEVVRIVETSPPREQPAPESFSSALSRVREENGVTMAELAGVMGLSDGAVSAWESGDYVPVKENLDKLYDVLPELRVGVEIGAVRAPNSRDIPKPQGNPRDAVRMAMEHSEAERAAPKPEKLEWQGAHAATSPALAPVAPPASDPLPRSVLELAQRQAECMVAKARAERQLREAQKIVDTARQIVQSATEELELVAMEMMDAVRMEAES